MLALNPGLPLLSPAEMRAAESQAMAAGVSAETLMLRAAHAAVLAIRRHAPRQGALVLCGPGNNGGDGYAIAALLRAAGWAVAVAADAPPAAGAAAQMAARWGGAVVPLADAEPAPVIIDALFGTGLARPLAAGVQAVLDRLQGQARIVIAIDIASGIDALTGAAMGRPLSADLTIAFGARKRGHVLGAGRRLSGRVVVADIGVAIPENTVTLVAPPMPPRLDADTHKYRRGAVLVVEGDALRGGASLLTALAALRTGAGLVTLAGHGAGLPANAIMRRCDAEAVAMLADPRLGAIAIGPGLADDQRSRDWLARLLAGPVPAVIDAGALALFDGPQDPFATATAPLVLTPHEGEFQRLFGAIGHDRVAAAQAAVITSGAVVLLKGPETIIAAPDGRTAINSHASPWLATAGSGDVLTGIIAALLAMGLPPFDAAAVAAWLHGDAGLRGGAGLIADDIIALLPQVLAGL